MAANLAEIRALHQTMQKFVTMQSKITDEARETARIQRLVQSNLDVFNDGLEEHNKLTPKQIELQRKLSEAKEKELKINGKIQIANNSLLAAQARLTAVNALATSTAQERARAAQEELDARTELANQQSLLINATSRLNSAQQNYSNTTSGITGRFNSLMSTIHHFGGSIGTATGMLGKLGGPLTLIFEAFEFLFKQLMAASDLYRDMGKSMGGMTEGGQDYESGLNSMIKTIGDLVLRHPADLSALDPRKTSELHASQRGVINALGGFENAVRLSENSMVKYGAAFGFDSDAGLQSYVIQLGSFMKSGIRPTSQAMNKLSDDISKTIRFTGLGREAQIKYFEQIAENSDTIDSLLSVRENERSIVLDNQRALIMFTKSLGLSNEKAMEAATALNKIGNIGVVDKLKDSTMMAQFGAMLGEGKVGQILAQEIQKPMALQNQQLIITNAAILKEKLAKAQMTYGLGASGIEALFGKMSSNNQALINASPVADIALAGKTMATNGFEDTYKETKGNLNDGIITAAAQMKSVAEALIARGKDGSIAIYAATKSIDGLNGMLPKLIDVIKNFNLFGFKIDPKMVDWFFHGDLLKPFIDVFNNEVNLISNSFDLVKGQVMKLAGAFVWVYDKTFHLFDNIHLPDLSHLFDNIQLPDLSHLFDNIHLPDFSQLFDRFLPSIPSLPSADSNKPNHVFDNIHVPEFKFPDLTNTLNSLKDKFNSLDPTKPIQDMFGSIKPILSQLSPTLDSILKSSTILGEILKSPLPISNEVTNSLHRIEDFLHTHMPENNPTNIPIPINIEPIHPKDKNDKPNTDKLIADSKLLDTNNKMLELALLSAPKTDSVLLKANETNKHLKIVADSLPTLVDLAKQQLLATVGNQNERDKLHKQAKLNLPKFNSDYKSGVSQII